VMFRSGVQEGGRLVISGDTLFAGSIGRTDLPGGDHSRMLSSLQNKVMTLPDDTVVLPGHGPTTTIGRERATNPYLLQLQDDALHDKGAAAPHRGL
jgi:hydroxyacylglutathione hydrolase